MLMCATLYSDDSSHTKHGWNIKPKLYMMETFKYIMFPYCINTSYNYLVKYQSQKTDLWISQIKSVKNLFPSTHTILTMMGETGGRGIHDSSD